MRLVSTAALAAALFAAPVAAQTAPAGQAAPAKPTAAEADTYVAAVEKEAADLSVPAQQTAWVNATYITDDTDALAAKSGAELTEKAVQWAKGAARFNGVTGLSYDTKRKLDLLKNGVGLPAPTTPGAATELATLTTRMSSRYGKGKGTLDGKPINGSDIEAAMGTTRDPAKLKEMWVSWNDNVGAPMRADYTRMTAISNAGAKELGFADVGAMWRSGYDMTPQQFEALTDQIWKEVEPLYLSLHTYVRWKLNEKYGDAVQAKTGPIRSDLLGNMWAQEWGNIYDLVAPKGAGDLGYDTGDLLKAKGYDPVRMVKQGEAFYSSLGFAPLPETFWQRSQIVKPADREVICHASAWDIDNMDDIRIKMCTKVNGDDFVTIHHELGHNYYQRAYKNQPYLYKNGANDGFHEAIGDTVALSITPDYLVKIGLLQPAQVPAADKDIGLLLRQAMDKVAFLPFGLLVDKWRWDVFSGKIAPGQYQQGWDALRLKYQGIVPPVARDETKFDAGAKYHIPGTVPYARYFLARVLQFQFYKAACEQAGWKGPLHRCSFYGNKAVGEKLNAMLSMGQSKPWPDALQVMTGTRQMSGKALVEYFAPLKTWLDQQNKGKPQGW
ncbi:peptidyl-dipeptidase [Sphingomonas melonis TY]|jgi:peptidyl-dipeptidase A|uniref:Peptidyl-dipeptidase n=1 Tax=Sphingomonas melonis TY TaxID=621456 RepID=A0A175Y0R3_9SPHN|nr:MULTISPECIES: M2 family metallopeptidase [Sphingomonas]AOW23406.1 peptidyl-dipeptidase [Sphingomonas melonis TY]ATI54335.1 peptidyl-dipeptidase [Sphingomonas melonis]KZB93976.1 peptidyl-dipeptidase [Sphingomonas melonis TY]MBI0532195.1 peptidase M2 family protein [Sphingomonas sp. TX0522]MBX8845812.1 M2 family metallopeptidase [Sphingomonas melonis]